MNEIRLRWEPVNLAPLALIEKRLTSYVKNDQGVSLLKNGTMLFVRSGDDEVNARNAMGEAKFLTDFEVTEMKEGDYFVTFHDAVAVFVGEDEFRSVRGEIISRMDELKLPSEQLLSSRGLNNDHYLIGLYGRGKLYRDAYDFQFHKRITRQSV